MTKLRKTFREIDFKVNYELARMKKDDDIISQIFSEVIYVEEIEVFRYKTIIVLNEIYKKYILIIPEDYKNEITRRYKVIKNIIKGAFHYEKVILEIRRFNLFCSLLYTN